MALPKRAPEQQEGGRLWASLRKGRERKKWGERRTEEAW